MRPLSVFIGLCAAMMVLAGCQTTPTASPARGSAPSAAVQQDWQLAALDVVVPLSLTVSEANTIKPNVDIVWHEDPCCDRHAQVDRIMTDALTRALQPMRGSQRVLVRVEMTRFHALTPRTRYSFGGEHEVEFVVTVSDAATGQVLRGPEAVDITFRAAGGEAALANEAAGYFQRNEIQDRVIAWARAEFPL